MNTISTVFYFCLEVLSFLNKLSRVFVVFNLRHNNPISHLWFIAIHNVHNGLKLQANFYTIYACAHGDPERARWNTAKEWPRSLEQLLFDRSGDEEINYIPCKVCAQLANHTLPRALLENFRTSSVGHSRRPQFTEPSKEGEPSTT